MIFLYLNIGILYLVNSNIWIQCVFCNISNGLNPTVLFYNKCSEKLSHQSYSTNISKNDLRQKRPCKCWLPFLRQRSKILLVVESRNRNMNEFQIIHLLFIITPKRYTNVWENLEAVKILNNHLAIFKVGWVVK